MTPKSGRALGIPYSLSRWTDVSAAKWSWFQSCLAEGHFLAFDTQTVTPQLWSLSPEDVLDLVFWTKDPTNLLQSPELAAYPVSVHMTITGWHEVEKGVPSLDTQLQLLERAVDRFGAARVHWRFSPVPYLEDGFHEVAARFWRIASRASLLGLREVFVAFLQTNDLMAEKRSAAERTATLLNLAYVAESCGIFVRVCSDDLALLSHPTNGKGLPVNLTSGICVDPSAYAGAGAREGCGCMMMADPFTVNESCTFGCQYCYAADRELSGKKRNTTRQLPVLR